MKEAAGEANMTVITIVLIAIVLAVGTVVVNNVMTKTKSSSCCSANGGVWRAGKCYATCTSASGKKGCSGSVSIDNCDTETTETTQ